jgi:hypothetical protein
LAEGRNEDEKYEKTEVLSILEKYLAINTIVKNIEGFSNRT